MLNFLMSFLKKLYFLYPCEWGHIRGYPLTIDYTFKVVGYEIGGCA
jgi:hypothetical protein